MKQILITSILVTAQLLASVSAFAVNPSNAIADASLYQRHPEFGFFVHNETILNALEEVLGPDIMLYENTLVYIVT